MPWPASLASETVATLNERGERVFREVDSERVDAANTLTGRLNKAKIDRLQLTPEMPDGVLTKQSEFLVYIPSSTLSGGMDTFTLTGNVQLSEFTHGENQFKKQIRDAGLLAWINAKLPKNVLTDRYTLAIVKTDTVPDEAKSWMSLTFGNDTVSIRSNTPQPVMLTMNQSLWGRAWDGRSDPVLAANKGMIKVWYPDGWTPVFIPGTTIGLFLQRLIRLPKVKRWRQ